MANVRFEHVPISGFRAGSLRMISIWKIKIKKSWLFVGPSAVARRHPAHAGRSQRYSERTSISVTLGQRCLAEGL